MLTPRYKSPTPPLESAPAVPTPPPLTLRTLVPAPLPPGFRIDPTTRKVVHVTVSDSQLVPIQHQRSASAPPGPCFPHNNNVLIQDVPPESTKAKQQENEEGKAFSPFQHWLSLFPESTIPMPFREALS
ncbi:Nn.00g004400.m01.CDS01 [Neocucurbitaria sp. VM-36]